ncbi:D-alanyl-D-alanine carboxypeptidase [Patescibacteria group bacterium]|nr:D-alanyl-D-alanine carboxypeptidase [Patescibacteria group bacterium]
MHYSILNLITSVAVVGVNFFLPILSVISDGARVNMVSASGIDENLSSFELGLKNQYLPIYHLPVNNDIIMPNKMARFEEFNLEATSGLIMDIKTKDTLYGKMIDEKFPIASITKLMTALVFLEQNPRFTDIYKVGRGDRRNGGKIFLYTGDEVKVSDLFNLALVPSANTATIAMLSSVGVSESDFVVKMNNKASELGLTNTFFKDATGLSELNVSTARDLAKLVAIAMANDKIEQAVRQDKYVFATVNNQKRTALSTDDLLTTFNDERIKLLGGKTGYTGFAKYCFVSKFSDQFGNMVVSVVLGAQEKEDRFLETEKMVKWVYNNYQWE